MNEVFQNLFVGSLEEYQELPPLDKTAFVMHAAKEPYHRQFVGYTGRACDKDHPEYLKAVRWNEIALNLVDAPDAKYFDPELMKFAVKQCIVLLISKKSVYIHCNQGESRAPGIAMLVLLGMKVLSDDYELAQKQFLSIYPNYKPGKGVEDFIRQEWDNYVEYFSTKVDVKPEEVIDIVPNKEEDVPTTPTAD